MTVLDPSRQDPGRLLCEGDFSPNPFCQFEIWLAEARAAPIREPLAMTLATATADGKPSARVVLLRGVDERGFAFFTNYESRKAVELETNPRAALVFWWEPLERQVRLEGHVERVSAKESDSYFDSRPLGSRLGAWASPQSQIIAGRDFLTRRVQEFSAKYPESEVPRPPHWGGYRLIPVVFEFWQGQPNRLHDRLRYRRENRGPWLLERLAP